MHRADRFAPPAQARYARAYIHSFNLPKTVGELLDWLDGDPYSGTKVDQVKDALYANDFGWTAPQWALPGDVIFFRYAARSAALVGTLRKALRSEGILDAGYDDFLNRAAEDAVQYGGRVFAVGVLTEPPALRGESDYSPHWRSRLEASIEVVGVFDVPLLLSDHIDVLPRPYKATTDLTSTQFAALKSRLSGLGNLLPEEVELAVPGREDYAGISPANWRSFSCTDEAMFWHETDVRDYFADYVLNEVKDTSTELFEEVRCLREESSGIFRGNAHADYVISLQGRLIPVETKVSVCACPQGHLLRQVEQYVSADAFEVCSGAGRIRLQRLIQGSALAELTPCLLIDQRGVYVFRDGDFLGEGVEQPLISRESIMRLRKPELRRMIRSLLA
jgi:hypothetical protein